LSAVLDSARDDNALGVKVVVGRTEYKIGDGLKVGYRANRDAYCLLVHRGGNGELTPLEPEQGNDLKLAAGERYAYPPDGTNIRITGPPGTDEVGLICSPGRIRLDGVSTIDPSELSVSVARYRVVQN